MLVSGLDAAADDALRASWELQSAASALGFDWPDVSGVLDKLAEELAEIRTALDAGDPPQAQRELGDLLLAAVNLARFLETDPADELRRANARFSRRFQSVREILERHGRRIETCSLEELDVLWERAKGHADQGLEQGS